MNGKEFARLLARDEGCLHCGEDEAIAPNHRINRGMGGVSKGSPLNNPSNLVVLCSRVNGLIESDADWRTYALERGWKLEKWQDPLKEPIFSELSGEWYLIDDDYNRRGTYEPARHSPS